jgi:non-canonical (house-cleaning) NTP pyrophosphatase
VLEQTGADWGAGLEGGVIQTEMGTMTTAWCVLVDREGRTGVGGAANVLLPEGLATEILGGTEMGPAMEEYSGIENVKKKMGAIGVLTRGLIDRQGAYECLVKFALARFLWEEGTPPDLSL